MKIYIDNYQPLQLLSVLSSLEKYLYSCEEFIEIISEIGIFHITKKEIYQLVIKDVPIINRKFSDFSLIIDKSNYSFVPTTFIPNNHISENVMRKKYSLNGQSFFYLVIEGKSCESKQFIPNNFYFEFDEEKKSFENCLDILNEFLLILNKY